MIIIISNIFSELEFKIADSTGDAAAVSKGGRSRNDPGVKFHVLLTSYEAHFA
jgi:hypothetical protein